MQTPSIELHLVAEHLLRMMLAFGLAFPLGWERGKGRHSVGFRTFPIVAMASCGYALIAWRLPGADAETLTRLLQGLVAGIGFIGGGTILKRGADVQGLVTAASLWNTGAIGVAVAFGRTEIAIVLSISNLLCLIALSPFTQTPSERRDPGDGEREPS